MVGDVSAIEVFKGRVKQAGPQCLVACFRPRARPLPAASKAFAEYAIAAGALARRSWLQAAVGALLQAAARSCPERRGGGHLGER